MPNRIGGRVHDGPSVVIKAGRHSENRRAGFPMLIGDLIDCATTS
jgi:hypothetical protein